MEPQVVVLSSPQGLTAPMPVITTLRIVLSPRALTPLNRGWHAHQEGSDTAPWTTPGAVTSKGHQLAPLLDVVTDNVAGCSEAAHLFAGGCVLRNIQRDQNKRTTRGIR